MDAFNAFNYHSRSPAHKARPWLPPHLCSPPQPLPMLMPGTPPQVPPRSPRLPLAFPATPTWPQIMPHPPSQTRPIVVLPRPKAAVIAMLAIKASGETESALDAMAAPPSVKSERRGPAEPPGSTAAPSAPHSLDEASDLPLDSSAISEPAETHGDVEAAGAPPELGSSRPAETQVDLAATAALPIHSSDHSEPAETCGEPGAGDKTGGWDAEELPWAEDGTPVKDADAQGAVKEEPDASDESGEDMDAHEHWVDSRASFRATGVWLGSELPVPAALAEESPLLAAEARVPLTPARAAEAPAPRTFSWLAAEQDARETPGSPQIAPQTPQQQRDQEHGRCAACFMEGIDYAFQRQQVLAV